MTDREAIEVFEKWKGCRDLVLAKNKVECDGSCDNCEFNIEGENTFDEAIEVAIEALKRELQNSCILDEEASNALMDIILKEDAKQASIPYSIKKSKDEKTCLNCGTSECELGNRARWGFCGNWTMREGDENG